MEGLWEALEGKWGMDKMKRDCIQNSQREKKSMYGLRGKNEWTLRGVFERITKGAVVEGE